MIGTVLGLIAGVIVGGAFYLSRQGSDTAGPSMPPQSATTSTRPTATTGPATVASPTRPAPTTRPRPAPTTTQPRPTPKTTPKPNPGNPLTQNSVYRSGRMSSVNCTESGARFTSVGGARTYWTQLLGCLNRAWRPVMASAKHPFKMPSLTVFSRTIESPCGTWSQVAPFYCRTNNTIYMEVSDPLRYHARGPDYTRNWVRAWWTFQGAHEYGHHIQAMTGILQRSWEQRFDVGAYSSAGLLISRRAELQAHCFAGVFLRANASSYFNSGTLYQLRWSFDHTIGERVHGSRASQRYWILRGYNSRSTSACNTWSASPSLVG